MITSFIFKFLGICISNKQVGNRSEQLNVRTSLALNFLLLSTKQPGDMFIVARRIPWPLVCP